MGFFLFILFACYSCDSPRLFAIRHSPYPISNRSRLFAHWIVDLFKYKWIYRIIKFLEFSEFPTLFITINGFILCLTIKLPNPEIIFGRCKFSHKLNMFVIHFDWNSLSAMGYNSNGSVTSEESKKNNV